MVIDPWNIELDCPRSHLRRTARPPRSASGAAVRLLILERADAAARPGARAPARHGPAVASASSTRRHALHARALRAGPPTTGRDAGNFDLMAPRAEVDDSITQRACSTARRSLARHARAARAAHRPRRRRSSAPRSRACAQAGRAIYDLDKGVYRLRELHRDPLPMEPSCASLIRAGGEGGPLHRAKLVTVKRREAAARVIAGQDLSATPNLFAPRCVDNDSASSSARCDSTSSAKPRCAGLASTCWRCGALTTVRSS